MADTWRECQEKILTDGETPGKEMKKIIDEPSIHGKVVGFMEGKRVI